MDISTSLALQQLWGSPESPLQPSPFSVSWYFKCCLSIWHFLDPLLIIPIYPGQHEALLVLLAWPGSEPCAYSPAACVSSERGSLLLKWRYLCSFSRLPAGFGDAVLLMTSLFTVLVTMSLLNPQ